MGKLFNDFLLEKEYVNGLSKVTLKGYRVTWRTFKRIVKEPALSRECFFQFVKGMIDEGLQKKTINTRCRIEEILALERRSMDFDNMFITVRGKGNKQRVIPFSSIRGLTGRRFFHALRFARKM